MNSHLFLSTVKTEKHFIKLKSQESDFEVNSLSKQLTLNTQSQSLIKEIANLFPNINQA